MAHLAHYKEAHPLPFVITHWINMVCMFVLIITGILIHFPYIVGTRGIARGLHMACAIIILINCVVRVILSFIVKTAQYGGTREGLDRDVKNFLPSKANRHQFVSWIKYYLFLKKDHPKGTKYGSPQKITYFAIPFLILFQGFTGFCLWAPTSGWPIFAWFTDFMGGAMNVRILHYYLMWAFIVFILIHIYLANVGGIEPSKMMFFHKEHGGLVMDPETLEIIGEDRLDGEIHPVDENGNPTDKVTRAGDGTIIGAGTEQGEGSQE